MRRLRALLRAAGFLVLTLPLMPVQKILNLTSSRLARQLPHAYHKRLSRMLGFHVKVIGDVPATGPVLFVANHVSWIDIVAMSAAAPVSFIAKQEVGGWPLFGQMARLQRTVFVNRNSRHRTGHSRSAISDRLKQGDMLVLFPEGTSHDGVTVLPFKSSLFGAVEPSEVSVIPVTIAYKGHRGLPMTRRQRPFFAWYGDMEMPPHLWEALTSGPIEIVITIHAPLAETDRKTMARAAHRIIQTTLAETLHGPRQMR